MASQTAAVAVTKKRKTSSSKSLATKHDNDDDDDDLKDQEEQMKALTTRAQKRYEQNHLLMNVVSQQSANEIPTPEANIANVVCTADFYGCFDDLAELARKIQVAEYNETSFAAMIIRLKKPVTTALIFNTGKAVITGADSTYAARTAAMKYAKILLKKGIPVNYNNFYIQNIVAYANCGFQLKLDLLATHHRMNAHYIGNLFPGLVFRIKSPKVVFLVYLSGKVVITGAKYKMHIDFAWKNFFQNVLVKYRADTWLGTSADYNRETRKQQMSSLNLISNNSAAAGGHGGNGTNSVSAAASARQAFGSSRDREYEEYMASVSANYGIGGGAGVGHMMKAIEDTDAARQTNHQRSQTSMHAGHEDEDFEVVFEGMDELDLDEDGLAYITGGDGASTTTLGEEGLHYDPDHNSAMVNMPELSYSVAVLEKKSANIKYNAVPMQQQQPTEKEGGKKKKASATPNNQYFTEDVLESVKIAEKRRANPIEDYDNDDEDGDEVRDPKKFMKNISFKSVNKKQQAIVDDMDVDLRVISDIQ